MRKHRSILQDSSRPNYPSRHAIQLVETIARRRPNFSVSTNRASIEFRFSSNLFRSPPSLKITLKKIAKLIILRDRRVNFAGRLSVAFEIIPSTMVAKDGTRELMLLFFYFFLATWFSDDLWDNVGNISCTMSISLI